MNDQRKQGLGEYQLKAVPIFAEKVEGDLAQLAAIADRWGASITYYPDGSTSLTLISGCAPGASRIANVGEWLIDRSGEGKGACTDEMFTASFEAVD